MTRTLRFSESIAPRVTHFLDRTGELMHMGDPYLERMDILMARLGDDLNRRLDGPYLALAAGLMGLVVLATC